MHVSILLKVDVCNEVVCVSNRDMFVSEVGSKDVLFLKSLHCALMRVYNASITL